MATDTKENAKMNFRERASLDIEEIKEVYDKLGIKFFFTYATLLGAVREKNIILTDHDVDIGLFGEDVYKNIEIFSALKNAGFSVSTMKAFQFPNEEIARPIWFITLKNVKVEHIFFFKFKNKRTVWYSTRKDEKSGLDEHLIWENDAKYFEPLEEIDFRGKKYLINNHAEELLSLWYKDWKIPSNAQVWGYKCPRFWTKDFDFSKEVRDQALDSTFSDSSSSSSSFSSFSLSSSSSKNK